MKREEKIRVADTPPQTPTHALRQAALQSPPHAPRQTSTPGRSSSAPHGRATSHRPSGRTDPHRPQRSRPLKSPAPTRALPSGTAPFLSVESFPGPLCLAHLERHRLAVALDASSAYLTPMAESLYGRAQVAGVLVPPKACAAELIAYWIWRGGTLPHEIAVVSTSHFRAERYGRRVTVLNRAVDPRQIRRLNGVHVTSPERTAVDAACLPRTTFDNAIGLGGLALFLEYYEIPVETCRCILKANPRWPGFSNAMTMFKDLEAERRKFE